MSTSSRCSFDWQGHGLELLAERAVWDPERRLLLVADLHLGKAEVFQGFGIPLPSDGDGATLNPLLALAHRLEPRQVVVLGDLIHSRLGLTEDLRQKIRALPELMGCPLHLIGGNHERGSWLEGLCQEPSQALGPWWLSHAPEPTAGLLNLCGHRHPVAVVGDAADQLRLPCFAFNPKEGTLVLPAFGSLTGGQPCLPQERLWLVAAGHVVPWNARATRLRPGPAPRRRG
ncbi:MAG: ligase-associated DNA damage response endonuclease PdeM [Cyanobium sp.]